MKKWLGYYIGFILLLLAGTAKVEAQIDPTLAGMILGYTNKAEKELKSQEKAMLMQTTGHLWMREEVEGTTDLQRTFNNYLDSFRDIVCYAAQIYGFYHEIGRLSDNMGDLSKQLRQHAEGAFAVALTPRRNQIYRDLILGSVEIVNDIRQVCMNNTKMTEKQRMEIVFAIRPKLKRMNKKLKHLALAVKYTSFVDVWAEIDEGSRPRPTDKAGIVQAAMRRWKRSGNRQQNNQRNHINTINTTMGKWSTILGIGKKVANHSATQTTARSIGGALVHPQRTLAGLGNATKTAVMGGGMGYLAWEKLVNDKPVVRAAADLLVGEEAVDKGLEMAGNATNKIADAADKAGESLQEVSQSVSSMGASWGGVGTFLRNMTGGNGMDMLGNFFGNLGKGNVSGLGIFGLLASAMLVFGRFGWLGKIAGALLGMMLIGNNSKVAQPLTPAVSEEQGRPGGMRR